MFKENDLVIYGATGVCRVSAIGRPDFVQTSEETLYYYLEPVYQSGIIYAPVENGKVVMRPIISAEEAREMLDGIDKVEGAPICSGSMQQLSQQYQNCIESYSSADLLSLAKAIYLKKLNTEKNRKKLGQIDKRYLKRTEDLIFGEFAAALGTEREEIADFVHEHFAK
ncbi:MAG: hypothetical protein IKG59_00595 [Firmicutes bacterium]|nr:hypothetical protein [Bacillota bacterium]